jgi:hypothetical protein
MPTKKTGVFPGGGAEIDRSKLKIRDAICKTSKKFFGNLQEDQKTWEGFQTLKFIYSRVNSSEFETNVWLALHLRVAP